MTKNPLNKGIMMENADGIGTVTPAMVEARARELALINGRSESAQMFEEGINEAEHDQMLRAAEEDKQSDEE